MNFWGLYGIEGTHALLLWAGLAGAGWAFGTLIGLIPWRRLRYAVGWFIGAPVGLILYALTIGRPGPDASPNPILVVMFAVGIVGRILYRRYRASITSGD